MSNTPRIVALVMMLASACDSQDGAAKSGKSEAKSESKSDAGKSVDAGKPAGAGLVDVTMTSGQELLQATPSECTLDAEGKGIVVADDGKFRLEAKGLDGHLVWKHPAGDLDMTVMIGAKGDGWVRLNGMTSTGQGYDGTIECK